MPNSNRRVDYRWKYSSTETFIKDNHEVIIDVFKKELKERQRRTNLSLLKQEA